MRAFEWKILQIGLKKDLRSQTSDLKKSYNSKIQEKIYRWLNENGYIYKLPYGEVNSENSEYSVSTTHQV